MSITETKLALIASEIELAAALALLTSDELAELSSYDNNSSFDDIAYFDELAQQAIESLTIVI